MFELHRIRFKETDYDFLLAAKLKFFWFYISLGAIGLIAYTSHCLAGFFPGVKKREIQCQA